MFSPPVRAAIASPARRLGALLLVSLLGSCPEPASPPEAPAGMESHMSGKELEAGFERLTVGVTVDALRRLLGAPNHVAGDQWYFGERRAPRVGENLPVYVVTVRGGKVVAKRRAPGADAVGPPP